MAKPKIAGHRTGAPKKRFHFDRRADGLADRCEKDGKADDLLTSCRLADLLDVTEQWVITNRREGSGPPFIQPYPEVIRYRRGTVVQWLRERARLASEYA